MYRITFSRNSDEPKIALQTAINLITVDALQPWIIKIHYHWLQRGLMRIPTAEKRLIRNRVWPTIRSDVCRVGPTARKACRPGGSGGLPTVLRNHIIGDFNDKYVYWWFFPSKPIGRTEKTIPSRAPDHDAGENWPNLMGESEALRVVGTSSVEMRDPTIIF